MKLEMMNLHESKKKLHLTRTVKKISYIEVADDVSARSLPKT